MKTKAILFSVFLVFSFLFVQPITYGSGFEMSQEACAQGLSPDLDIKDSLILSLLTFCLPGIVENIYEYRQIQCEEIVCTYDALISGYDPTVCSKEASYNTCVYIVGEIFSLPILNIPELLRESVSNYLQDPVALGIGALRVFNEYQLQQCVGVCESTALTITSTTLAVFNVAALTQRVQNIFENGLRLRPSTTNHCDRLSEIESEVDDILRQY